MTAEATGEVIVVSGLPGAGKTTLAAALARHFDKSVHLEADLLQKMIVRGGVWPGEEPIAQGFEQLALRGRNICSLADAFCHEGFTAIVDDVVIGDRFDEFTAHLATRPFYFILLLPSLETLRQRNLARGKDAFYQSEALYEVAQQTPRHGMRLDNSSETAQQTCNTILSRYRNEARVMAP
ncbi:MAG TPA: AAA family ATPase [Pseudomonadales bacterium]|nr:AAA family ATPase [Pseudomonadales bacterium]